MFYIFPTNFVYWEKIKNHNTLKEKYIKIIEENLSKNKEKFKDNFLWGCECQTSFFNIQLTKNLFDDDFINDVIWEPMDNMLKELGSSINLPCPKNSHIEHLWYNNYDLGNWQEIHDHTGKNENTYSGIYVLKLDEENPTVFVNSGKIRSWNMKENYSFFDTLRVEEGNVIFFPSELMHYVNPCKNNRITVSFNISSTF